MRLFGILAVALTFTGSPAAALGVSSDVRVTVDADRIDTNVGDSTTTGVRVANLGVGAHGPMTAHLVIVDPVDGRPVDPEDWTDELTRAIPPLEPGQSVELEWTIRPITAGSYALFVATVDAVAGVSTDAALSRLVPIQVEPPLISGTGPAMAVSVGVPVILGMVLTLRAIQERKRKLKLAAVSAA